MPPYARGDLTDEQWRRLRPLLPERGGPGRPPRWTRRQLIDGIRWRTRTGAAWRDVPARYGPWQTVYGLFRRWQLDGTWQRVLEALPSQADAEDLLPWEAARTVDHGTPAAGVVADGADRSNRHAPPGRGAALSSRPREPSARPVATRARA